MTDGLGEVAERSKAAVLKTADPLRDPGVRIPPSPPVNAYAFRKIHKPMLAPLPL